jgi:uncharacterized protein YdeI (YjbR/CyaY-like superfamily)
MNNKHQTVEEYITNSNKWKVEMEILQSYLLDCGLNEALKWGVPCYMHNKSNVVLIGSFKEFVSLSFFKGVLLADSENLLHKPGENSQAVRMFKFTSASEIIQQEKTIKAYIYEAIEVEKTGVKVPLSKATDLTLPEELLAKFEKNSAFKEAFFTLTPGRQRGYNLFFSDSKQSNTRIARIEKYEERILKGIGINDCVCGLSKRMPRCDGSHKQLA